MLQKDQVAAICHATDEGFDRQIALTSRLVAQPSMRGNETDAQQIVASALTERDFKVDSWPIRVEDIQHHPGYSPLEAGTDGGVNVVGVLAGRRTSARSLILNGHIDVVPPGERNRWTSPAFLPVVRDGHLFGRGSGDMKSGLVAAIFAIDAVRRAGFALAGDIIMQSVVEEECTGNGAVACLARGYSADAALVPEPAHEILVKAMMGVIWVRITVPGDPAHAGDARGGGINAIERAMRIWSGLKSLEAEWNARRSETRNYADQAHPIRFNLGRISGGNWVSSVPDLCTLEVRAGVYPGWSIDAAALEIEQRVQELAALDGADVAIQPSFDYHGYRSAGYDLDLAHPAVNVLSECHREINSADLAAYPISASSDARILGVYGNIPSLMYGPVAHNIHAHDECVDLASVRRVTKTIALFAASWCGVEPA